MRYFVKTPWYLRKLFSSFTWKMSAHDRSVYLTFDDGPHPVITNWVLDELKKYKAYATFFCVGENVMRYPEVFERIVSEGHAVGNHTHTHVNGWKTGIDAYLNDVRQAAHFIPTNLFRPPYGRITSKQAAAIASAMNVNDAGIIMWDILSADFDASVTPEKCLGIVTSHAENGSIIVFHDSEKAERNLRYALPGTLEFLQKEGYVFNKITQPGRF